MKGAMLMEKKMKSMMSMDRNMMGMPSMSMPTQGMGMNSMNMMMIPRCMFKMEKMKDGMRMRCIAADEMAAAMMQNLCTMMSGGMVSFQMMMNGMTMMTCNMMMGMCKCEMTTEGICITCTSGDAQCCKMIQDCCQCMMTMMDNGCMCCMSMNNTPVCCGSCE
jgi:hypothetical protein